MPNLVWLRTELWTEDLLLMIKWMSTSMYTGI